MAYFDLPSSELRSYSSQVKEPHDFEDFWGRTLAAARDWDLGAQFVPVATGLRRITTYDVQFSGFGGQRIRGWYLLPLESGDDGRPVVDGQEPFPVIVQFIGYGGGRGLPADWLFWPSAGYATLVMDTRGQGSTWRTGDTPDGGQRPDHADGPQIPGFMTRGIQSPETSYFTRLFVDGTRAVEVAALAPMADAHAIVLTGVSQGGGLTLAVSALAYPGNFDGPSLSAGWERPDYTLRGAMPDVPFLCDLPRAIGLVDTDPYNEIVRYLKSHRDKVSWAMRTYSYLDGVNMAGRCALPSYFSVALMDTICPPSTVYGAYNRWAGSKKIEEYPFNNHEGGQQFHQMKQVGFVRELFGV